MATTKIIVFGYKYGVPDKAELGYWGWRVDVRKKARDPKTVPALKGLPMTDPKVRDMLKGCPKAAQLISSLVGALKNQISWGNQTKEFVLQLGDYDGKRTAMAVAELVADEVANTHNRPEIVYRDKDK